MRRDSGSAKKPARPKRKAAAATLKEASSDGEAESSADEDEDEEEDGSEDASTPGPSGRGAAANRLALFGRTLSAAHCDSRVPPW